MNGAQSRRRIYVYFILAFALKMRIEFTSKNIEGWERRRRRRVSFAPSLKPLDMKLNLCSASSSCYSLSLSSLLSPLSFSVIKWIAKARLQQTVSRRSRVAVVRWRAGAPAPARAKTTKGERRQERKRERGQKMTNGCSRVHSFHPALLLLYSDIFAGTYDGKATYQFKSLQKRLPSSAI